MDNNAHNPLSHNTENTTLPARDSEDVVIESNNAEEKKRSLYTMMDGDAPGVVVSNATDDIFVRKAIGKDGEPLSEKKLRRLEKNRLSARECRRRKREANENMERQINLLEGENLRLRQQLQVSTVLVNEKV
jgi:hypothetical protein